MSVPAIDAQHLLIREEMPGDYKQIAVVNKEAFGRVEEADLVERLRAAKAIVASLVAVWDGRVVGHALCSPVLVRRENGVIAVICGLGPVAVLPAFQRQGIGSDLIEAIITACREAGYRAMIVLGHPDYYPRFGFQPANLFAIRCAFEVPAEAFMARPLRTSGLSDLAGLAHYHPAFNDV